MAERGAMFSSAPTFWEPETESSLGSRSFGVCSAEKAEQVCVRKEGLAHARGAGCMSSWEVLQVAEAEVLQVRLSEAQGVLLVLGSLAQKSYIVEGDCW